FISFFFFFFQAEDGIRDRNVTGVQTCALPIYHLRSRSRGQRVLIVAGTGPVGIRAAGLFARAGAEVVITSRKPEAGERARELVVKRFGGTVQAITMSDAEIGRAHV